MSHANTVTNRAIFKDSPHPTKHLATADSGASGIYIAKQDVAVLTNTTRDLPAEVTHVQAAEGSIMTSHATGDIVFTGMPDTVFKAQVFDKLQNTLVGVGAIIDQADVKAILARDSIQFVNPSGDVVLAGPRCLNTGLWSLDLGESTVHPQPAYGLGVRPLPMESVGDLVAWWHASFGYPVASRSYVRCLLG
jgi:hypothetical protein